MERAFVDQGRRLRGETSTSAGRSCARSKTRTPLVGNWLWGAAKPVCQEPHASLCHGGQCGSGIRAATSRRQLSLGRGLLLPSCSPAPSAATRRRPRRPPSGSRPRRSRRPPPPTRRAVRRAAWPAGRRRSAPSACRSPGSASIRLSRSWPSAASRPEPLGVAVVLLHDDRGQRLDPRGHRPREPVHRRRGRAQRRELLRVGRRDRRPARGCRTGPAPSPGPRNACSIGYCWSSIMPDQQRERVVGQHLVGGVVAGDVDGHVPILPQRRARGAGVSPTPSARTGSR